jgi:hypothetical protein
MKLNACRADAAARKLRRRAGVTGVSFIDTPIGAAAASAAPFLWPWMAGTPELQEQIPV